MKFFTDAIRQFLRRLEQERNPPLTDIDYVAISAGLLQVSEFRFFQVAYADWYGREISTPSLEPIFTRYMFDNVVPHWVRRLTRIVLSRSKEGTLDPRDFNIRLPKCDPHQQTMGWHYVLTLILVLAVFLVLVSNFEPY